MALPKDTGPGVAYAAGLRAALKDFTAHGGTQKELAAAAHISPATLSRYLSGERIAPAAFLTSLNAFLTGRGRPLGEEVRVELEELCGQAHEASRSPAVQLVRLQQELARVREEKQAGEAELSLLKTHADQLAEQLRQALEEARRAEADRSAMVVRVNDQDKRLGDAQLYTRRLQAELTAQHNEVVRVQREVEVLRRQNQQLLAEDSAHTPADDQLVDVVPGVSTQADKAGASAADTATEGPPSTSKPRVPRPGPVLGHATTQKAFSAELKKLRAWAGGDVLWSVERMARVSRGKPWPMHGDPPREDRVLMARWFDLGTFPDNWKLLEPVIRALGASPTEVSAFHASFHQHGIKREKAQADHTAKVYPVRAPTASDVMEAVLLLAAITMIGLGTTAVLQSDTESGIAKTLTVVGALTASLVIWVTGLIRALPPNAPHAAGPRFSILIGSPLALATSVILPFVTGSNEWGHWTAGLIGLL
ncbi:helix-turn-helix transcriptional regulator [Streptomyces sp. or20]|uniref:helix-turn-helix domain-containing protein n=2 Tax=Streptomyces TaxID=1883 RepID=UPI0015CEFA25|nr:helix-turn-helix transcriptional regulator [Streptomyces sp. or20]